MTFYTSYGGGLPDPIYDASYSNTDYYDALWKACTDFGIRNVTLNQTFTVYETVFTVAGIEPGFQIELKDPDGMMVAIPDWPWASPGA